MSLATVASASRPMERMCGKSEPQSTRLAPMYGMAKPAAVSSMKPCQMRSRIYSLAGIFSLGSIEAIGDRGHRKVTWHAAPLSRTLKPEALGCQRPSNQGCLVPVCEHGHGGCDDSSGDTRLARGLPFGSMPLVRPPPPMPEDIGRRED